MRVVLWAKLVAFLLAPAEAPRDDDAIEPVEIEVPRPRALAAGVNIEGIVAHAGRRGPIVGAQVVIDCTCLDAPRAQLTDEHGRFLFVDLPAGAFRITVSMGRAKSTLTVDVLAETSLVAHFALDPNDDRRGWVVIPEECDRACRKARRAERRRERPRGRTERSCKCPPSRRCPTD